MGQIIKKHLKSFVIVAFLILICNLLNVLHPFVIKQIIDLNFTQNNIFHILLIYFGIYVLIHLFLVIFRNITNIRLNKTMAFILRDIRESVFRKVLRFKMKTFNKYNSSEIYTRLTNDTDNLFDLFFGVLQILIDDVTNIVFMILMMYFANINLAIIGTVTICVIAVSSFSFTKILKKLDNKILDKRDKENREFSEMYNKNKLTYLFNLQEDNYKNTSKILDEKLKLRKKYIFVHHFMFPVSLFLQALGIFAILYYSLKINTSISYGSIYLAIYYIRQCASPLNELFNQLEEIQTCLNSLRKINRILKENDDEDIESGIDAKTLNGDIEFKNVYMKYDKEMILKNLSFVIEKGSKVTIAGRTGVGKTTLTNSLMRLYDIHSGQILINGYDISKISIKSLRDDISYISQNPYIFDDTLRNNITLGNENITDDKILDIIHQIGVENIYNRFPKGLDEVVKESRLSYGELQVISFIRAISHKSNIYILDEPTSNIDLKTEKLIQKLIDKISENSTVIIVAHRKSTIDSSDKIIYLKNGQIDMIVNK